MQSPKIEHDITVTGERMAVYFLLNIDSIKLLVKTNREKIAVIINRPEEWSLIKVD